MSIDTMRAIYEKGIFFLADSSTFSYAATCLADGLNQLGVPVFSNISYSDPLITDFRFEKCKDTAVRDNSYCILIDLQDTRRYYEQLTRLDTCYERVVALCMQDDVGHFCIDGVAALLCTHENRHRKLAGNRIPIAFGLSSAMIRQSLDLVPGIPRSEGFLCNFRPSLNQDLRACLDLVLLPLLRQYVPVNHHLAGTGRWNARYYDLLRSSFGCLAYGGTFEQDLSKNEYFMRDEKFRAFMPCVDQQHETVVLRWDSWRFWESLAFGCVTMHLDFGEYGFALPVMPENWKHYVGISLSDVRRDVERLMDERQRLPEIAWSGRQWAIENYSPLAVGRRFAGLLQGLFY